MHSSCDAVVTSRGIQATRGEYRQALVKNVGELAL